MGNVFKNSYRTNGFEDSCCKTTVISHWRKANGSLRLITQAKTKYFNFSAIELVKGVGVEPTAS